MAKNNKNKKAPAASGQYSRTIIPKSIAQTRSDVQVWKSAYTMANNADTPKMFPYYNLVQDILQDAHLTSQLQNRKLKTLSASFSIKKASGEIHEELTKSLQKSKWFNTIISHILDSQVLGYTLLELDRLPDEAGTPVINLIPRQNVIPTKGIIVKDYTEDKGINYLEAPEYGSWLLDFGSPGDLGIINKAIPHVLFMRFAQSCWSELCEIVGIPPRVMKTNTQNPAALRRAEKMMTDMGAAAWFIIDDTEKFEFAPASSSKGEVYDGLITLCKNNISLLFSGAIIGQDTKYGSRGKEESSQNVLQDLTNADQTLVEQEMNEKTLSALYRIGILPEDGLSMEYDQADDLQELWNRTKDILAYKKVDNEWISEKFGIKVIGDIEPASSGSNQSLGFFD